MCSIRKYEREMPIPPILRPFCRILDKQVSEFRIADVLRHARQIEEADIPKKENKKRKVQRNQKEKLRKHTRKRTRVKPPRPAPGLRQRNRPHGGLVMRLPRRPRGRLYLHIVNISWSTAPATKGRIV